MCSCAFFDVPALRSSQDLAAYGATHNGYDLECCGSCALRAPSSAAAMLFSGPDPQAFSLACAILRDLFSFRRQIFMNPPCSKQGVPGDLNMRVATIAVEVSLLAPPSPIHTPMLSIPSGIHEGSRSWPVRLSREVSLVCDLTICRATPLKNPIFRFCRSLPFEERENTREQIVHTSAVRVPYNKVGQINTRAAVVVVFNLQVQPPSTPVPSCPTGSQALPVCALVHLFSSPD